MGTKFILKTSEPSTATTSTRTIGTKQVSHSCTYDATPADLTKEQQAFQPGVELIELFFHSTIEERTG